LNGKTKDWYVPSNQELILEGIKPGDLVFLIPLKMSMYSLWGGRWRYHTQPTMFTKEDLVRIPLKTSSSNYDGAVMFLEKGTLPGTNEGYIKVLKEEDILQVLLTSGFGSLWGIEKIPF
jgi:hypothetical protein